jgi:RNA-directed DNA polymerase
MTAIHWFSFASLYQHYQDCARGESSQNIASFHLQAEKRLIALAVVLCKRHYQPQKAQCFVVDKPKCREVVAASFQDRIVHRVLVSQLNRIFEPKFIAHSCACRVGKGAHRAITAVAKVLRARYQSQQPTHLLHLDIHNFFLSINHTLLWQMLERKIRKYYQYNDVSTMPDRDELLWLTKVIIDASHAVNNPQCKNTLPAHKQLSQQPQGVGLPIGNYASQLFGNIYLDQLDQWVPLLINLKYNHAAILILIKTHKLL